MSKEYAKIKTDGQLQSFPNPYRVTVSNPSDTVRDTLAGLFNWLEVIRTPQPEYDPETQYVTDYWEEENGKAVQHWEVHDNPPEPENAE